ncbi:MAG TPA: gliding motility-associated C-terminal domain-containing protein [Chryseosolibacter sp.]|nr:gliding motility-associated C-terminal domain-containing protein [Chryseosolibacter sp.]
MIVRAVFVSFLLLGWSAQAQYLSVDGKFQVDQVKGCAPFTVTVTPVAPFGCDTNNPCAAFYENATTSEPLITPPFTHTYAQPGIYNLKILRSAIYDSIRIEVVPNIPPSFDVYNCGNYEVFVKVNDSNYDEYVIDYNDGSAPVIVNPLGTHNYSYGSSATQTITIRGRNLNASDNCNQAGKIVTPVLSLSPPTITLLEVLDNSSIRLEYDIQPNIQYKLGIATNNATTFQQLKTVYNSSIDTIVSLKTDDNYYCFQLAAFDPCNNAVVNSTTICSANIDVAVRNNAIDLTWATAAAGISNFRLQRDASDGTVFVTAPTGSPYVDAGIICGIEYCYQLTANYPNGSRSVSLSKCGIGFSTDVPTAIGNITSIVNDNSVVLEWETDPNFIPTEFTIEKSIQANYRFLATSLQDTFVDPEYNLQDASCYRIRYKDLCDNGSPLSIEACPVRLSATLLKDNSISLTWTLYQGWTNGVSGYTIEKYNKNGALLQTFQIGNSSLYVDTSDDLNFQTFVYVVKANPVDPDLGQSVSNRVVILKDPNLFHPTAFTPNGDNLNDQFTVFGQYVTGFEMKIFNRWGELLFTTQDIQSGWDGTFRGNDMPEGTYTFIALITDRAGRTFKRSGSVLLLRKGE